MMRIAGDTKALKLWFSASLLNPIMKRTPTGVECDAMRRLKTFSHRHHHQQKPEALLGVRRGLMLCAGRHSSKPLRQLNFVLFSFNYFWINIFRVAFAIDIGINYVESMLGVERVWWGGGKKCLAEAWSAFNRSLVALKVFSVWLPALAVPEEADKQLVFLARLEGFPGGKFQWERFPVAHCTHFPASRLLAQLTRMIFEVFSSSLLFCCVAHTEEAILGVSLIHRGSPKAN